MDNKVTFDKKILEVLQNTKSADYPILRKHYEDCLYNRNL